MIFADNLRTPFDLSFRLLRFSVSVSVLCWIVLGLLFGEVLRVLGFDFWLIAILCGFVSLLVHELGHAITMRWYGSPARIELSAFGGVAIPTYESPNPWRRMVIAAAGPLAGFTFVLVLWLSNRILPWGQVHRYFGFANQELIFIGIAWNLLSLVPVWPMDGSRIVREILVVRRTRTPDYSTQWFSMVVGGTLAVVGFVVNFGPIQLAKGVASLVPAVLIFGPVMVFFFAYLAFLSYERLRQFRRPRVYRDDDRLPWER